MAAHRVAILGTSFGGKVHGLGFQRHPGFDLVAIAGRQADKTRRVASELGVEPYDDWQTLLERVRPEVVAIATPTVLHHPMMMAALERGCHVLCEKPTAMNRHQAAEMRDRAAAAARVAAINHEFRFFAARRHALTLARDGAIGKLVRGEILGRYALWPRPESRAMSWLSDRASGGGILGALGSHHTDCLRLFFGEPRAVSASVRVDQPRRGPTSDDSNTGIATADDACTVFYEFDGGATALIDLDARAPYRWERFEIHGSEGTLRWDERGDRLWRLDAGREPAEVEIPESLRLDQREGEHPLLAPFVALLGSLHGAIEGRAAMAPDFDDAVAVQSALDAVRASSAAGRRVAIEIPAAAVIPG